MSAPLGTLEAITAQLTMLNSNLSQLLSADTAVKAAPVAKSAEPEAETASEDEPAPAKKAPAKKAAAKTTAKRAAKPKADDLSNMVVFKKALFDAAETSGVADVMPKLKKYLKAQGYGASDEIENEDRADFVKGVKEHFAELADGGEETEADDFDI